MTDVRTFRATTMQEALDVVRAEMGSDAVILHTRQFSQKRFLPWKRPIEQVEITAGLGVNIQSGKQRENRAARPARVSPQRRRENQKPQTSSKIAIAGRSTEDLVKTKQTADSEVYFERSGESQKTNDPGSSLRSLLAALPNGGSGNRASGSSSTPGESAATITHDVAVKLDSIQKMLEQMGRQSRSGALNEIPDELFHIYTDLIDSEVEDDLSRSLVSKLKEIATPDQLSDPAAVKRLLAGMVESELKCCGPITTEPGKRKVVALVGATGVGKTTTIAKLAANLRLRDGVKMGLVTVDTYRIAAVEQLRTYAEIIDLPMKVVTSPPEMRRALDELVGLDLVLIDTAGRSPRDDLQIQELKSLLAEANVDEVHLVVNVTASLKTLEATAKKFATANTTSLIMTKLDEAAGMGTLLSISQKIPLPISYLTTGQDVPDDIEAADASRISRLVLGWDKLSP